MRLAALILLLNLPCIAATIHVPADQPTIQAGIDAASSGDTVLVACGQYFEHGIQMRSGVYLTSASGNAECVTINAQEQGGVFVCNDIDASASIVGFTITGGGSGVLCLDSDLTIMNCFIYGNSSPQGGGIYCNYSYPTIIGCTIVGNSAQRGGGIAFFDSYLPFYAIVSNCTISSNSSMLGSGIYSAGANPIVIESIIAFGTGSGAVECSFQSFPQFSCSNIYGTDGGDWTECIIDQLGLNGNISEDPIFCDIDSNDFSLQGDSPCAPENNDCGVLMGAWPVGCSTNTSNLTWSAIKTLY